VDSDPSEFNLPQTAGASIVATPQVSHQETTANLADGASLDFDFNIDSNPLFDMFVFADQALVVRVFVRQGAADTYRQLGADYNIAANVLTQPFGTSLQALRVPGSQTRVRLLNASGAATTVLSAQVHSRSL
jgi:hypothetical protein